MPPPRPCMQFVRVSRPNVAAHTRTVAAYPAQAQSFSSSTPDFAVGPESPHYIEVPKPLQASFPSKSTAKGHLPMPRDVFRTRSKHAKESDVFIKQSTPRPQKLRQPGPYSRDAEYTLYKQRLAESRRQAFEAGVHTLHERKARIEAAHLAKIQRNNAERRELAMAPPRTVDLLTQTSVSKGVRDFLSNELPTTSRAVIVQARKGAYERRMALQDAVRQSRLHDLYTNAREFITNEEQLDEAIEKAFGTDEAPIRWDARGEISPTATGQSPWEGPMPEGVTDKLHKLQGGEGISLATERVKKVVEALTGGKM